MIKKPVELEGVVYHFECNLCKKKNNVASYVGETTRKLRVRINEHFTLYKDRLRLSEISKHVINEHDGELNRKNWNLRVIYIEKDEFKRKAAEAFFIHKLQPNLNLNKGALIIGLQHLNLKELDLEVKW